MEVRSLALASFTCAVVLSVLAGCGGDDDSGDIILEPVPDPVVEGPISSPGVPFVQATSFNLAEVGYMQEEYYLSGTARAYTNVGELTSDGEWTAETTDRTEPYKTRIVVHRPIDPQAFNGSVIVEWLNVSGGLDAAPDWISAHTEFIRKGYAWVGVSAQLVGIEGAEGGGPIPGIADLSLKGINPARYGSLHHPGDTFSYDMYSQVGQALRSPTGIDPLEGLERKRVIAAGESQSAFRMVTYVNAIHPTVRLYDGFMIHSRGGSSAPLSQQPEPAITMPPVVWIRADIDVPVLTFQTETDLITLGYLSNRQPDGPRVRLWEAAGTAHADLYTIQLGFGDRGDSLAAAQVVEVSAPLPGIIECDTPINAGPHHFVLKAAFAALDRWVRTGEPPPSTPLLELVNDPAEFVLDEHGNVRGGIRTPYVDVPTARLSGLGQTGGSFCRIFGTTMLFDAAKLASLYSDHAAYVAAVSEATDRAVEAGFVLADDAQLIKDAAAAADVP